MSLWGNHRRKQTVEGAHQFPVNVVERFGGVLRWSVRGKEVGSANYTPEYRDDALRGVMMRYTVTLRDQAPEALQYFVPIVQRTTAAGIRHQLWICPLVVNGQQCDHTVRSLYLPGGGRYFGCRHCYHLTFTSRQAHDKNDWRRFELLQSRVDQLIARHRQRMQR